MAEVKQITLTAVLDTGCKYNILDLFLAFCRSLDFRFIFSGTLKSHIFYHYLSRRHINHTRFIFDKPMDWARTNWRGLYQINSQNRRKQEQFGIPSNLCMAVSMVYRLWKNNPRKVDQYVQTIFSFFHCYKQVCKNI